MRKIFYKVYDFDISKNWLISVDIANIEIKWNKSIYVPEKYKEIYIKNHLSKILKIAKNKNKLKK